MNIKLPLLSITKKLLFNPSIIPFILGFSLVAFYIFPLPNLLAGGENDAYSIWQTIISFGDDTITSSYVLYKGFLSVYPYVWFHNWAISMGQDPFIFIKLYHALLFAYVSAIGLPDVISNLLSVKLRLGRNLIFVCLLFYLFKFTHIFNMLMIDLPSWVFFVAAISAVLKLSKHNYKPPILYYYYAGGLVGLSLCASGQYSIAGYLLIIYLISKFFVQNNLKTLLNHKIIIFAFFIFILGFFTPQAYDTYFEKTIVQPMRARGDWLPTGGQWLINGMTRLLPHYKYGYPGTSNRGLAIIKKNEGDIFSQKFEMMKQGSAEYSKKEYLHIIKNHAFDFIVMWGTKAFLSISFDGGNARLSHLLISYLSLYICFYLLYLRCKKIKDLLKLKSIIVIGIISTIAAPVFLMIDMRYIVTLQSFIIGFALLNDYIWHVINQLRTNIFNFTQRTISIPDINIAISYPLVFCVLFILFCFLLYGALLEIPGSDPNQVLFNF